MGALASIIPMVGRAKLPPYTLRFKANRAVSLSDFRALPITLTLVDDARHIYDVKLEQNDWSYLFKPMGASNTWLVKVIDANTFGVTDTSFMFSDCTALEYIKPFDTSSVTGMYRMMYNCESLKYIPLFNTTNTTNVSGMLYGCRKAESGVLTLYTQMSTQANPPTSHADTFTDCGIDTPSGLAELQQIPTSWGGLAS